RLYRLAGGRPHPDGPQQLVHATRRSRPPEADSLRSDRRVAGRGLRPHRRRHPVIGVLKSIANQSDKPGGTMTALFDRLTYEDVARTIDHSLLRPELDDDFIQEGCKLAAIVATAHPREAIVKVILENAYLDDDQKVRGCRLTEAAGADFVKTSTGFAPTGATHEDLALMRRSVSARVGVKAAGGVRTLDGLLAVMELGVTRIGATQTAAILDEFRNRKAASAQALTS